MKSSSLLGLLLLLGAVLVVTADDSDAYFWNEVTGETQWEDPGDVPHVDTEGRRYWLDGEGKRIDSDPNSYKYVWMEQWSDEHGRPYFYNQETRQSTWERPVDLAWRRVAKGAHDEL